MTYIAQAGGGRGDRNRLLDIIRLHVLNKPLRRQARRPSDLKHQGGTPWSKILDIDRLLDIILLLNNSELLNRNRLLDNTKKLLDLILLLNKPGY